MIRRSKVIVAFGQFSVRNKKALPKQSLNDVFEVANIAPQRLSSITDGEVSILEKANNFKPRSFIDAPI